MKNHFILVFLGALLAGATAHAQPAIDEQADRILREMGEYLSSAEEFSFRAEIGYDEFTDWGQEVQYGGVASISVRRPDGLHVVYDGDQRQSRIVFDGETVVFHDLQTNLYATTEAPGKIDDAVDRIFDLYGYSVPVADLVYSDPYETLIGSADFGVVVGRRSVDGMPSFHLAFSGEILDWQIWIEDGPRPVPRQLVITYKEEPGAPQYRARFSNWDFQPRLSDHYFEFDPPAGSAPMEFLPVQERPNQEREVEP
jgi:hypothetical protein